MLAGAVFVITAYGWTAACGGAHTGVTKTGTRPREGWTVAADPRVLPLGSVIHVEGLGLREVEDVGSAIKGRHVDVFFDDVSDLDRADCAAARDFGVQRRRVTVVRAASGGRRGNRWRKESRTTSVPGPLSLPASAPAAAARPSEATRLYAEEGRHEAVARPGATAAGLLGSPSPRADRPTLAELRRAALFALAWALLLGLLPLAATLDRRRARA